MREATKPYIGPAANTRKATPTKDQDIKKRLRNKGDASVTRTTATAHKCPASAIDEHSVRL